MPTSSPIRLCCPWAFSRPGSPGVSRWVTGLLSLDDPKLISPWVDIPYGITELLLLLGLPLFFTAVLGLVCVAWQNQPQRRQLLVTAIVSIAALTASFALLRWDPLRIVAWYAD